MNVLWVMSHPDPRSLTAFLAAEGRRALSAAGHEVEVSDLYAMGWNPVVDAADYAHDPAERFLVAAAAKKAHGAGALSADIRAEQEKLDRADALVVQFPLWWFGMPAILKGWFDRVFVQGYAYGLSAPDGRPLGYGEGFLSGRPALTVVSTGGPARLYGGRGIHGDLDELLFPLQHGTLYHSGATVLPPLLVPGADRYTPEDAESAAKELRERLLTLWTTEPVPFRPQDGGDYEADRVLRPEVAPGRSGLGVHRA
ncbi:NAD(P)H-dependent oxidoreductase [Streptomyces griseoaurantiacus]|uniref:NAD(P)H-dependent oxidoreductase n=1 Tax=Streptomyces griseoaurantiacus TaxID=68213 RepID=UPI002E2CF50C|nr:NAD(P)H-dependent oxidoreductase [Streptomyces jietaisiensis]